MPTYPEKGRGAAPAEARKPRAQRLQPSPDPRLAGAAVGADLASRAAEIGTLFQPARRA
jgi:hypothetical protein